MAQSQPHQSSTQSQTAKGTKTPSSGTQWTHGKVYWSELMTHDVEKAKTFYKAALGWTFEAMPMDHGTYWIIKSHDETAGGMFEMKDAALKNMPEQWVTYIAVDDVDARLKKALSAGAKVVKEPFEIKGVGRNVILREPGGALVCWMTQSRMTS